MMRSPKSEGRRPKTGPLRGNDEIRRPKAEGRPKPENRITFGERELSFGLRQCLGFRSSFFGFPRAFGIRASSLFRVSTFVIRHSAAPCIFLIATASQAASNSLASNDVLRLRPPRGEIPLTYWEQHRLVIVSMAALLLILVGVVIWFVCRPRPVVAEAPAVLARRALEPLRQQAEDGALLSRVSQIARRYVVEAFELGAGELTTTEFCRALAGEERIGPELAAACSDFLRRCDERKFAPAGPGPVEALGAVRKALELIEKAEARRAWLRQSSQEDAQASGSEAAAKG